MHFRKNILQLVAFGISALLVFTVGVLILNTSDNDQWIDMPYAKR
jgi:hypothetical protein